MKILFVKSRIAAHMFVYYDYGIASMSAVLKEAGHETSFFNVRSMNTLYEFERRLKLFKPDIVGFSCTAPTFPLADKYAEIVKKWNKKAFYIVGGPHITLNPNDLLKTKFCDAVCVGEGEYSLLELVSRFKTGDFYNIAGINFRKGKKIIVNKCRETIKDLDVLPFPDREIFANEGTVLNASSSFREDIEGVDFDVKTDFMVSRGCPFDCTFCSNHALKKIFGVSNYVRYRSPELAIKEIENTINRYRTNYIIFDDDILLVNRKWGIEFLNLYKKRIDIPFECNVRIGVNDDKEMVQLLKDTGCKLVKFGIETGSERIRKEVLNRYMTNKQIINSCSLYRKMGIKMYSYIMLGLPEETKSEFLETIDLTIKVKVDGYAPAIFYPYPGTKLYDVCKDNIKDVGDGSYFIERYNAVLRSDKFPIEDVEYYQNNIDTLFVLRAKNGSLLKRLYRGVLFDLYFVPPSSKFFYLARMAIFLIRMPMLTLKFLINVTKQIFSRMIFE